MPAGLLLTTAGIAPARLGRDAFNRPTLTVARDLLGKFIVHRRGRSLRSAMITEVEAYKGPEDLASHARGGRRTQDRVRRDAGQPERFGAHDAGAVDGVPDGGVLLEHPHPEPALREPRGRVQPGRAAADDEDVGAGPGHTLLPRRSHRPRNVIQKESAISRTSSQKLCFRTYSRSYRNLSRGGMSRSA